MDINKPNKISDSGSAGAITRREFLTYSAGTVGVMTLGSCAFGGVGTGKGSSKIQQYPISPKVTTTLQEMIAFPKTLSGLTKPQLSQVEQYCKFGYGNWTVGSPLPLMPRTDLMPKNYSRPSPARKTKLVTSLLFLIFTSRTRKRRIS